MAVIAAFRDGWTALRRNPVLLVAGFLFVAAGHLTDVGDLVDSTPVATVAGLAWLVTFPFVAAGLVGMTLEAVRDSRTSLRGFVAAGRTYYGRMLGGTVLFVAVVFVALFATFPLSIVSFLAMVGLGPVGPEVIYAVAAGLIVLTLLFVLAVVFFLQFFGTAIVVEDESAAGSLRRSAGLVRANLASVLGFSVVWMAATNLLVPDLLLLDVVEAYGLAGYVSVDPGLLQVAVVTVGVAVATVVTTYLYTVQTAYYLRLVGRTDGRPRNGTSAPSPARDRRNAYPGSP